MENIKNWLYYDQCFSYLLSTVTTYQVKSVFLSFFFRNLINQMANTKPFSNSLLIGVRVGGVTLNVYQIPQNSSSEYHKQMADYIVRFYTRMIVTTL